MTDASQVLYSELTVLHARETLRPVDKALAEFIAQSSSEPWVQALVGLVSARLGRGELSLHLDELSAQACQCLLEASTRATWLSLDNGIPGTPLILHNNRIYLRRFWQLELDVNQQLHALEEQGRLRVITGPPGSGKTTRLKALIDERLEKNPDLRVALAAPTGKAVHRLQQVLAGQANIATVHRLLGVGGQRSLAYLAQKGNGQPLPFDLAVIDEASMVGLELAQALLNCLPPHAELLLVGDANQLPSVEPGQVFASLCTRIGPTRIQRLQTQYRFKSESAIGQLAAYLQSQPSAASISIAEVLSLAEASTDNTVECLRIDTTIDTRLIDQVVESRHALITMAMRLQSEAPMAQGHSAIAANNTNINVQSMQVDLLRELDQAMVLTPFREGSMGSLALNKLFQRALHARGLLASAVGFTTGLPVICIQNDYDLDLMNGSLGVVIGDMGLFDSSHGPRLIPLQQCPALEPAFALTVHKAQGSEFTNLVFLLAESPDNPLSVPLVYTAITRAREALTLVAAGLSTSSAPSIPSTSSTR